MLQWFHHSRVGHRQGVAQVHTHAHSEVAPGMDKTHHCAAATEERFFWNLNLCFSQSPKRKLQLHELPTRQLHRRVRKQQHGIFVINLIGNSLLKYPRDDRDENSLVASHPTLCVLLGRSNPSDVGSHLAHRLERICINGWEFQQQLQSKGMCTDKTPVNCYTLPNQVNSQGGDSLYQAEQVTVYDRHSCAEIS